MLKAIRYGCFTSSLFLFPIFRMTGSWNGMLLAVMLLWLSNCLYSFENLRERIYFLFMHLMMYLFILSRPTIDFIRGKEWWIYNPENAVIFTVTAVFLALLFLFFGAVLFDLVFRNRPLKPHPKAALLYGDSPYMKTLRLISLAAFCVCLACFFYTEMDKFLFMRNRTYTDYYSVYDPKFPFYIRYPAGMAEYFMFIYLATLPKKRSAFFVLGLYLVSLMPSFLFGLRSPLMLGAVFVFLYYYMRDSQRPDFSPKTGKPEKKWLGTAEKTLVIIAVPAAIFLMYLMNYFRAKVAVGNVSVIQAMLSALHQQGVTFHVIGNGYNIIPLLPKTEFHNYTFGHIIDYFRYNSVSRTLFGTVAMPWGNSLRAALEGNKLSHALSYLVLGNEYLYGGRGLDSSFVLEPYVDWGWVGQAVFCGCFGFFLLYLTRMMKKGWFARTLALCMLLNLYFAPRSAALGWFNPILSLPFWAAIIVCVLAAKILSEKYTVAKLQKREYGYAL